MRSTNISRVFARSDAARRAVFKRWMGLLFSSSFGLILMMSCQPIPTLTQAAANTLSLSVIIRDQYTNASQVSILISFAANGSSAYLGTQLSMICDGVEFAGHRSMLLPRQPAGSAYQCIYTDEKGKKTTLSIPVPSGMLAITSPMAGTTVLIPGTTSTDGGFPRPPGYFGTLTILYTVPTLPPSAKAQIQSGEAICGDTTTLSPCGTITGGAAPTTGSYTLSDEKDEYGQGFETFTSGSSGEIDLNTMLSWPLAAGGFHDARVEYDDHLSIPVIWSRG